MKKKIKFFLYLAGTATILMTIVAAIAIKRVDLNRHKESIEKLLNQKTGLDWDIKGDIAFSPAPLIEVTVKDVHIRDQHSEILRADTVRGKVQILPLLSRSIQITEFEIANCSARIEKDEQGRLNCIKELPSSSITAIGPELPVKFLTIHNFAIKNGVLTYANKKTNSNIEVDTFDFTAGRFQFIENQQAIKDLTEHIKNHILTGSIAAEKITVNRSIIKNVTGRLLSKKGIVNFEPVQASFHDAIAKGTLSVDLSSRPALIQLKCGINNYNIEHLLKAYNKKARVIGPLDATIDLTTKGLMEGKLLENLNGLISIKGENLVFTQCDIDNLLKKYEESQCIGILDLGGLLLLGPFGPFLSKGYNISGLYLGLDKGESTITKLVTDWRIENGIARADDVAFASTKNRVAVQGKLDLIRQEFNDFQVAILDADSCERFSQTINGPFQEPEVKKVDFVRQVFKPVQLAIRKSKKILFKENGCTPFYNGIIPHPSPRLTVKQTE